MFALRHSPAHVAEGKKAHQCWVLGGFLHTAAQLEEQSEDELLKQADAAFGLGADIFEERCGTSGQDCYFLGEMLREKCGRVRCDGAYSPNALRADTPAPRRGSRRSRLTHLRRRGRRRRSPRRSRWRT